MYRVLIVDDTPAEIECLLFLIRQYGLDIAAQTAPNGREALALLSKEPFDILLTDIKMPLMDGLQLARAARALDGELQIVLFSGYGEFEYAKTAIAIGVTDYLMKPIVPDEFARTMRRVTYSIESERRRERESAIVLRHMIYLLLNRAEGETEVIHLPMDYAHMMLLEFPSDFFGGEGDDFEHQLRRELDVDFDFIALYPVRALVLFRSGAMLDAQAMTDIQRAAATLVEQRYGRNCLVGYERVDGAKDFRAAYQRLEARAEHSAAGPDVADAAMDAEAREGKLANRNIESIKQYIQQHYDQSLSLTELAQLFYFNPSYLCHAFKRETGCNLVKYINDYRMKRAQEMLQCTSMKINHIAQAVGYKSASYFIQRFRDCFGVTPEQFRQAAPLTLERGDS